MVSRPDGEQLVKDTQPQCTNIKQSGVNDQTNKSYYLLIKEAHIYIYIYILAGSPSSGRNFYGPAED